MERIRIAALFAACSLLVMSASAEAHAGERPLAIRLGAVFQHHIIRGGKAGLGRRRRCLA